MSMYIPMVIEKQGHVERAFDLYSRLLVDRIVFLGCPVNDDVANIIVAEMLFLESQDSTKPIYFYINSPGGSVSAGLSILDTMKYINSPVETICVGMAASMAAVLLAAGEKGRRHTLTHSRVMIHQVSAGAYGQCTDMEIQVKEVAKLKKILNGLLAEYTGQPIDKVVADCERDYYMSAEEAVAYGLVDDIMKKVSPPQE